MSNGRPYRRSIHAAVLDLLGPLDGARIPGGCDHCDSYQTTRPAGHGVWIIDVHHDAECPVPSEDAT